MSFGASWFRKPIAVALVVCIVLAALITIPILAEAQATVALSPESGYGNSIVTISGSGFTPAVLVKIHFASIPVLSTRTESDGSFTDKFIVPTDQDGVYRVTAVDAKGRKATTWFTVIINPMLVEIKKEIRNIEDKLDLLLKPPPLTGEVTIGALLPLSGDLAAYGENERAAIEFAVEEVNAFLTKAGAAWTLKVVFEDTQAQPSVALEKVQSLAARGIKFIVGPLSSGEVRNIKEYADANKILVVSHASTAPDLAFDDYIFRFCPQDKSGQGPAIARLICDEGISTVVAVYRNDIWGTGLVGATETRFKELTGKEFAEKMPYDPSAPDFRTLAANLASAVETCNADSVLYIGFEEAVNFFKEAETHSILGTIKWYGSDGTCLYPQLLDPAVGDFCVATKFTNTIFAPTKSDKYQKVHDKLVSRLGHEPDPYAYVAYDILWALTYSLLTVNKYDSEAVRAVLPTVTESLFGASGWIVLDENGDRKFGDYDLWRIVEVEAGAKYEWKLVGTWLCATDSISWLP